MAKKKFYNRAYLRQHYASKTFVSIDGLHVEREYFDTKEGKMKTYHPSIHEDQHGIKFIRLKNLGDFEIAELVISCYCVPKPKDGKIYEIEHIDGDLSNDNANNLRWVEATPQYLAAKKIKLKNILHQKKMDEYKKLKIRVLKDGTIKQGNNTLTPFAYIDDRDLDWFYNTTSPRVEYSFKNRYGRTARESVSVDTLMADFGFVKGGKANFKDPVILHVNNDYMDFTPDNLEWCDVADQRYIDYQKIAHDEAMKKDRLHNRKWLSPESWVTVYGINEPYQDWSEFRGTRPEQKAYEDAWTPEKVKEELEKIARERAEKAQNTLNSN